jgi:hypothetical protein
MLRTTPEAAEPEPVRNDLVRTLRPAEPQPGRYDQLKVEIASSARTAPTIDLEALQSPDPTTAPTAPGEAITPTDGPQRAATAENSGTFETMRAAELEGTVHGVADHMDRAGSRFLGRLADYWERAVAYVAEFLAPEPPMTRQQVHDALQANVGNLEKDHAQAVDAAQRADDAAYEQQAHELKTAEQQANLSFSQRYGTPPTSEATLGKDRDLEPD